MSKLMRRVASVATSAAIASGALLAAGGSASAATPSANEHSSRVVVAVNAEATDSGHRHYRGCDDWSEYRSDDRGDGSIRWSQYINDDCFYPWVYDQLVRVHSDDWGSWHGNGHFSGRACVDDPSDWVND